jgi:hypothetical protein
LPVEKLINKATVVFKGTVSRDFRHAVFFINQPTLGPWFTG